MNDDQHLLISRLASLPEWLALEAYLNEQRDRKIASLITGGLSHDEYVSTAGEIRGLEILMNAPRMPAPKRVATTTRL